MSRTTAILRGAAKAGASVRAGAALAAGKQEPMSADHTLYHLAPTGFWKKFRDAVVVNPEISSGLPIPLLNRYPQPGSRAEKYAAPATSASDPAFNPYYKRDARRSYPRTSYITQSHLSTLLLSSPTLASLPSPTTTTEVPTNSSSIAPVGSAARAVAASSVPTLSTVLEKLPTGQSFIGAGLQTGTGEGGEAMPPSPPGFGKKWVPMAGDEIPRDEDAYFPMIGYK